MPLTCSVGLTKKLGLPQYGSLGASCTVEFELEGNALQTDPAAFHQQVRNAYREITQAIHDELARQQNLEPQSTEPGNSQPADHSNNNGQRASQKQTEFIQQLARQIRGLGVRRLETLADKMFSKPLADLSSLQASSLIDTLKAIKSGDIDHEDLFKGAAP